MSPVAREKQTYNQLEARLVTWLVENYADLPDAFADWVGEDVSDLLAEEDEETGVSGTAGHLFCGLIGAAALGLIDLAGLSGQVGDAIAEGLMARGLRPLPARLIGLLAKRVVDAHLNLSIEQLTFGLCAVAVAVCPDPRQAEHGNTDINQCEAHLGGGAITQDIKQGLGVS